MWCTQPHTNIHNNTQPHKNIQIQTKSHPNLHTRTHTRIRKLTHTDKHGHTQRHTLVEVGVDDVLNEELGDVDVEEALVPLVHHVTSVVDAGDQELEGVPWNLFKFLHVHAHEVRRDLRSGKLVFWVFLLVMWVLLGGCCWMSRLGGETK